MDGVQVHEPRKGLIDMEWVEITGRTIEEAKDVLLDQLGVQEDEAEFEVLEEPRAGLFGRTRGQARVRARIQPKAPRGKDERRKRTAKPKADRSGAGTERGSSDKPSEAPTPQQVATETPQRQRETRPPRDVSDRPRLDIDVASREASTFLEDFIRRFGITGEVTMNSTDEGDLEASVSGEQLGRLIGPRGGMIRALEELTRTRLQHVADGGSTPKLRLDVGGYRQMRRDEIQAIADETIEMVRSTGKPHVLNVVMAGERKVVHDRVGEVAHDLSTQSEGEDPQRRVVVLPGV